MPSPFVTTGGRVASINTPGFWRRNVASCQQSFFFHFRHRFFYGRCRLFAHFLPTLVSPNCVCYQCLTTGMCNQEVFSIKTSWCNPAHCPHTLCPMKCLVLSYSTIVTISMSGLISLLVKRQTVNPSPGAVTGGN